MKKRYNAIIGIGAAVIFSVLYIAGVLTGLENRLYDFFLKFRANRQRIENVVFLDVDDPAIAYNGIYPWPRSIPADGLIRLKEYGIEAVIFDIEYIDHGPQGVDSLYLNQGLGNDFHRTFSEISNTTMDILSAISTGRIGRQDIDHYSGILSDFINSEWASLYSKAQGIARDNDLYLAQAIALNGKTWSTLNLRETELEVEEEAARRPNIAELRFAYPINAQANAHKGAGFVDVLTALPRFAESSRGAGFTNVEIDPDGVRRRVYLAQNIQDHWYLQLSFAPLIEYLGNPAVNLSKNKLIIKQAKMPDGRIKDISIPLDSKGRMLLDWPKEDYNKSYVHISFADFSLLDDIEAELELYSHALAETDLHFFIQFDSSLAGIPSLLNDITDLFNAAREYKTLALENTEDDSFNDYLKYRDTAFSLLGEIFALNADKKITDIAGLVSEEYPEIEEAVNDEAGYISFLIDALNINLNRHIEKNEENKKYIHNNFVIIGRVDTGTTDYGANPFHPKYINVGTHGVVLDTILSESFITYLDFWWSVFIILIFVPLFFILSQSFSPVLRSTLGFGSAFIFFAGAVLLFRFTGIYWGPLGMVLALILAVVTREIISYSSSEKEKQFIRSAFSTYLSGDVVEEIIADPSRLQLGGTKRNMTAIFTDVRSFSTISEKLDPEELVSLLNRYLGAMSDIILEQKGTIDKYEGDAIIAFFGAPLELPDHALRACISAIKIKKLETSLNEEIMEQNLSPMPLLTRVGINTGKMVVGNMGTATKMNYTIMGDAVNLAARLEGVNKQYGTWVLASEDTIKETGNILLCRKLDRVRVVGKSDPVRLCELVDIMAEASGQAIKTVDLFHNALEMFEKRDWKKAAEGFKEVLAINPDDEPSKMYIDRCKKFIKDPPKETWDGVYNLTSK